MSKALGSISSFHLKNSADIIQRLKSKGFRNKKLVSFDVKSLFTNVPIDGAMSSVDKFLQNANEQDLPLNKEDYRRAVELCLHFNTFSFGKQEYRQHSGLAMGSPLSAVLANLYMETLEADHYRKLVGPHVTWVRYVDDVLAVLPRRMNTEKLLESLNKVEPNINFTIEEEIDNQLPFLDTVIIRTDSGPLFKVYRKPTNKEDLIHYLSAHNLRVKSGMAIGLFLRAFRI